MLRVKFVCLLRSLHARRRMRNTFRSSVGPRAGPHAPLPISCALPAPVDKGSATSTHALARRWQRSAKKAAPLPAPTLRPHMETHCEEGGSATSANASPTSGCALLLRRLRYQRQHSAHKWKRNAREKGSATKTKPFTQPYTQTAKTNA